MPPPKTSEQHARREIDTDLSAAGWLVQSREDLDLTAGRGIAIREFPMRAGFAIVDHLRTRSGAMQPEALH